ncbi:MAG TPA: peptide chain release factor N(5)-glutamine methyltransferase [Dongiaceae bacterium]
MTVGDLLKEAAARLAEAGIASTAREARLLLQAAGDIPLAAQMAYPEREVEMAALVRFQALVARRARREPMAHILGRREFWSLPFKVTADTLDPRPDSETLIQAVLDQVKDRSAPLRMLDFGTGTGCLLLALLHELGNATGLGIDLSPATLAVAEENARVLGLAPRASFRHGDWDVAVDPGFDVIVSNPPYIATGEIAALQPEVARFEPRLALDGGPDGLAAYRRLMPAVARLLKAGALVAFETGAGQGDSVIGIGQAAGLRHIATAADLGAVTRCVTFRK